MLSAVLLSLLAPVTAPNIAEAPASVLVPLHEARLAHDRAGMCLESVPRPALDSRYQALAVRIYDAVASTRGLWAKQIEIDPFDSGSRSTCGMAAVQQALDRTSSALDAFDRAFAAATAPLGSGAWLGVLKLCRARTLSATIGPDEYTGQPALTIKFDSEAAARLATLTDEATGGPLAIRLDGVVVARPTVLTAILHGTFQLSGPDRDVLERLRLALDSPC